MGIDPAGRRHHPDRTPYHVCSNGGGGRQRAVGPDSQRQRHHYLCRLSRATNALGDLTTDAAGRVDLGGSSIVTLEDQTYGDQVQLGTDTTLTGRHITFAQTAEGDGNGPWDLTVNGSGITTFAGSVGATNALGD